MLKVVAFILSMVVCAACHCQEYSAELLEQEADNLEALEELRNDVGEHHPDYAVTLAALGRIMRI